MSQVRQVHVGVRPPPDVRVSTARQAEEGLSLEAQERRVREYVEREGWELTGLYVERGVSGRRAARPELDKLLADLDGIDRLVIPKLDRLGRSNRHLHDLFEALQAANVELVSLADNIDTSTSAGRLMRNMLANLAEFESTRSGSASSRNRCPRRAGQASWPPAVRLCLARRGHASGRTGRVGRAPRL